ncbi:MAG: hypothetical protein ABSC63_01560 [Candidatus Binataceae bacterium]
MRIMGVMGDSRAGASGEKSRLAEAGLLWLAIIWIFGSAFKRRRPGRATARAQQAVEKGISTACALTLVSPEMGEKYGKAAGFHAGVEIGGRPILHFHGLSTPCRSAIMIGPAALDTGRQARG